MTTEEYTEYRLTREGWPERIMKFPKDDTDYSDWVAYCIEQGFTVERHEVTVTATDWEEITS